MGIIIDIILIAIIVFVVVSSKSKGFVSSFLDTISLAVSAVVSFLFSRQVADAIYNFCVKDLIKTTFKNALDDMSSSLSVQDKVNGMIDALPEAAVKLAEYVGVNVNELKFMVSHGMYSDEQLIETVADKVAYNVMISLLVALCFIVLFIVTSLLVKLVSSFMSDFLSKLPFVGKLNETLGAVFGFFKGCIIVIAVSVLLTIIVATATPDSPLFGIEESYIYSFLKNINPLS